MGTGIITNKTDGDVVVQDFFNDIHSALNGDFVGRNSSGVPTAGQSLGTPEYPWGTIRGGSLVLDGSIVDSSLTSKPPNIIISGKTRTTSNQPAFITPNGSGLSATISGSTTPLVYAIKGVEYTLSADITVSGLTAAPSTQNTGLENDLVTGFGVKPETRWFGESGSWWRDNIWISTTATNITNKNGQLCAFKTTNSGTEYFLAMVDTNTDPVVGLANWLRNVKRGWFYDSSLNPINPVMLNGNTVTIMSLGWLFLQSDGATTDVSYTTPKWQPTQPSGSPATGDYWYDQTNDIWKRFDGSLWQDVNRTLIGMLVMDTTACVAARCEPFYEASSPVNTLEMELNAHTNTQAYSRGSGVISVAGNLLDFGFQKITWDMTTDLADSADLLDATEQSIRTYYLYIKDTGVQVISDIAPYWDNKRYGHYHRHNPWRCVGWLQNDGSSNIASLHGFANRKSEVHETEFRLSYELAGLGVRAGVNRTYGTYNAQYKNAGTGTNVTGIASGFGPSIAYGFKIRGNVGNGGTGTNNEPELWTFQLPANRKIRFEWYANNTRGPTAIPYPFAYDTTFVGALTNIDYKTATLTVDMLTTPSATYTTRRPSIGVSDYLWFDVVIQSNNLPEFR